MDSLFNYFTSDNYTIVILLIAGIALAISLVFTFLVSLKLRATKGFFITSILMPVVIASIIATMDVLLVTSSTSNIAKIATIAVALGLLRFRSNNARAEELLILFVGIAVGLISGLGYVVIASIVAVVVGLVYLLLSHLNIFNNKRFSNDKLLKITIPESLEYSEVFDDTFSRFLKNHDLMEVKTTDMGSLFKLSYKITLKDKKEEKEFIDELRTKNGNLEISILPYVGEDKSL